MFTHRSHEHACNCWKLGCLPLQKCPANWMHIAFIVIIAMKLTILWKQFVNNLWNFILDFPWCNDQMHFTYGDQYVYDNDMIHERPSHTTVAVSNLLASASWQHFQPLLSSSVVKQISISSINSEESAISSSMSSSSTWPRIVSLSVAISSIFFPKVDL